MQLKRLTFFLLAGFLLACSNQPELPAATPSPVVVEMATSPTAAAPTAVSIETAAPTPTTAAATPEAGSPTPEPVPTEIPPTPLPPEYTLTVTNPLPDTAVLVGQDVVFSGTIDPAPVDSVDIRMQIGERVVFSGFAPVDAASGTWTLTTAVSPNIVGPADLIVAQNELGIQTSVPVQLSPDIRGGDAYITLERPVLSDVVAAGHPVFFAGQVANAIGDTLTIAVLTDQCTNIVSRISFSITSGIWNGLIILPPNISGDACAIAFTGALGEGDWREARVPVTIVDPEVEPLAQVEIGNRDSVTVRAGETAVWYGSAITTDENEVRVLLVTDASGQATEVLIDEIITADAFGYWEAAILIPASYNGPALLTISAGEDDTYAEARLAITITP